MSLRDIGLGLEVWAAILTGWWYFFTGVTLVLVVFAVVFIDWETLLKRHQQTADHVEMETHDEIWTMGEWGSPLEMLEGTEDE